MAELEPSPALRPDPAQHMFGNVGEFDPKTDNIVSYLERLQLYFEAKTVGRSWSCSQ